jgi:hypothetical protein
MPGYTSCVGRCSIASTGSPDRSATRCARRALAESVGLVFAVRQPSETPMLSGLPEIAVHGRVGDVNAQIGDSDTGGTVTMGTVDSEVHGGNSR